jgi:hypothetical protein
MALLATVCNQLYAGVTEGGPLIEVLYWAPFEREGTQYIGRALIAYQTRSFSVDESGFEKSGDAIKKSFAGLTKSLHETSTMVRSPKGLKSDRVSNGAQGLRRKGRSLRVPFDGAIS